MACQYCNLKNNELIVYESDRFIAMLSDNPVTAGHILLFPKHHYTIFEQVPDDEVSELFVIANDLSVKLFEKMKISGTNLLVNNGVAAGQIAPHFMINIIPRKENDGLDFQWPTKPVSDELMLNAIDKLSSGEQVINHDEEPVSQDDSDNENILIEHVNRIP
ncbi:HIT family protein [Candidatus Woesearchaeota archaeon]|nr:HIT family protein [Candidatus Woesearchaeota archaeon]